MSECFITISAARSSCSRAVLEQAFACLADAERQLNLDGFEPVEAITRLAHFIWNYYFEHQELLRLLNNENLHEARYIKNSSRINEMMSPVTSMLGSILRRGAEAGVFRKDVDALRFYVMLSALGYYVLSNRYTLAAILGRDFIEPQERAEVLKLSTDMVLCYLRTRPDTD